MRHLIFCFIVSGLCACASSTKENNTFYEESFLDKPTLIEQVSVIASDEFQGRKTQSKGSELTRNYLINEFNLANIKPYNGKYSHRFSYTKFSKEYRGENLIAIVKGHLYPNKYIVLSAHYDHIGTRQNSIYNGADDNASGTAALLSIAQAIEKEPLEHSVIFLFTDGEEAGLQGSKAFVKDFNNLIINTKLNINIDMIAGDKSTKYLRYISRDITSLMTQEEYKQWLDLNSYGPLTLKKGFKSNSNNGLTVSRFYFRKASDHASFSAKNIPYVYFGVGVHKNYHKTSDTIEHLNVDNLYHSAELIFKKLRYLDRKI